MDEDRRSFLKKAGCAGLGLSCGFPLLSAGCSASTEGSGHGVPAGKQLAMVVDVRKCKQVNVSRAITEACITEHNVPRIPEPKEAIDWIKPEGYMHVFPDQAHEHTADELKETKVLALCNHCARPSCVRVCPTGATWKRASDGVVMMDMHRCIGCRYCIAACGYGARNFNWRDPRPHIELDGNGKFPSDYPTRSMGVVEKCTFCTERLRAGRPPACVEAAAQVDGGEGALTFGRLDQPDSPVRQLLREKHTICRRIALGTGPNVYYIV